jgi:DNA-binding NarL/FixJ family response regulator
MGRIRVLLALPRMVHEIVGSVLDEQPDIDVIAERVDRESLPAVAAATDPDLIIISVTSTRELADDCEDILRADPTRSVLAVAPARRQTLLYQLVPRIAPIGDLSPGGLLRAVRTYARRRPADENEEHPCP